MRTLLTLFQKPSATALAQQELEEAQRQLLAAQSATEWAQSQVTYNLARIDRLELYLKDALRGQV